MNASNRLFALENVSCRRGGRVLFQNLSFAMGEGDVAHLAGPNGSGKTSLLRIMAGALPCAGRILWQGRDFLENDAQGHAARFAFLPSDDRSLKLLETAGENLRFWAGVWRLSESGERIKSALAALGIPGLADTPVRYLSAGQKRRLSLARALMKGAQLWLLDEPLNGLDAPAALLFKKALDAHVAQGGMAAIASHHAIDPPRGGALRRVALGEAA